MKITDVKTYLVEGYHERLRWVFVHVETDEGVLGLGDATNWPTMMSVLGENAMNRSRAPSFEAELRE